MQTHEEKQTETDHAQNDGAAQLGEALVQEARITRVIVHNVRELGALLRVARQRLNMSQTDAAICCGVGRRFYVELENGKETVRMEKVLAVLDALGLNLALGGPGMAFTARQLANAYIKQEDNEPEHVWDAEFSQVTDAPFEAEKSHAPGRKSGSIAVHYRRKSLIRTKEGEIIRVDDPLKRTRRRRRLLEEEAKKKASHS